MFKFRCVYKPYYSDHYYDIRNKIHVHFVSYVLTYNHANIGPIMVTEIEV